VVIGRLKCTLARIQCGLAAWQCCKTAVSMCGHTTPNAPTGSWRAAGNCRVPFAEFFGAYRCPLFVVGDPNIHLDRVDDPHTVQLRSFVDCYGLHIHEKGPTNRLGGILDVVKTAVLTYRALHGSAPRNLSDALLTDAEMPNPRRLRSSTSNQFSVPWHRLAVGADHFLSQVQSTRPSDCLLSLWPHFESNSTRFCFRVRSLAVLFNCCCFSLRILSFCLFSP
jgi:hypothetical protein